VIAFYALLVDGFVKISTNRKGEPMEHKQAIEKLNDIRCHVKETSAEEQALVMAIEALKQPEIIRCGECEFFQCNIRFDGSIPKGADEYECRHRCGGCDPMDYCSYGKRRERRTE
jgi:hypothetical protein